MRGVKGYRGVEGMKRRETEEVGERMRRRGVGRRGVGRRWSDLDLSSFVPDDPRHCGESGELVGCHLGIHTSQIRQESGLTH